MSDNVDFNFLEYELSLFNIYTRWISNFFRSWLVFYRFGLVDNVMRHLIEFDGSTPWNDDFSAFLLSKISRALSSSALQNSK